MKVFTQKRKRMMFFVLFLVLPLAWMGRGWIWQHLAPPVVVAKASKPFVVIAHRGASAQAPENTWPAFEKALDIGAHWIEFDVHLSADGRVVVMHDASLERTTNGTGTIAAHAWADMAGLDAGSWFHNNYKGTAIPLLSEVLEKVQGRATLLIELKVDAHNKPYKGLTEKVWELIKAHQAANWCIIQSFEQSYLLELAQTAPESQRQQLIVDDFSPLPCYIDTGWKLGWLPIAEGCQAINSYYRLLTPEKIAKAHQIGMKVYPYTVDSPDDMRRMLAWGADGLITNQPELALELQPIANE